jgi:CBS domain-containing protein
VNTAAATITPETTIREVMTIDVVTLKLDDTLSVVDDLVNRLQIRHFPVLDNDQLAGVICQADLLCASLVSLARHRLDSAREALSKVAVKDVMKPATVALPETSIYEAARIMVEGAIECLIVMEGQKLLGIVSRTDLLRELARQ